MVCPDPADDRKVETDVLCPSLRSSTSSRSLLVILLLICTSAYVHQIFPAILDSRKDGYVALPDAARVSVRGSGNGQLICWRQARGHLLEKRKSRGETESVHKSMLRGDGSMTARPSLTLLFRG